MSFFIYADFVQIFMQEQIWWVVLLVAALCYAIVTVFQGIGLYTIAAREGYRHKWMSFVPFLNTYYTSVCAQKNRCFNVKPQILGIFAAVYETLLFATYVLWYCADFQLTTGGYVLYDPNNFYAPYSLLAVPAELNWAKWCFEYLFDMRLLYYAYLLLIVAEIMIYSAFFQTYSCRRYFFFTVSGAIFSFVFPIYGILTYAVRNNTGMNYKDFLRREQERQYRAYQQYYRQNPPNPYDRNPYSNNGGGYNPPPENDRNQSYGNGGGKGSHDDPFSEFGTPGDPFDFDNDKN